MSKPTTKTVEIVETKVNSNMSPIDLCNTQDVIHESPPLPHPQEIKANTKTSINIAHSLPVNKKKANSPPVPTISIDTTPLDTSSTSISSGSKRAASGRLYRQPTSHFTPTPFVPRFYTTDRKENRKANKKTS